MRMGCVLFGIAIGGSALGAGAGLTVDEYLRQVEDNHLGFKAAEENILAADERKSEAHLATAPQAFANAQNMIDNKETANVGFFGDRTTVKSIAGGVQGQTEFGTQAKLSYGVSQTEVTGTNPALVPSGTVIETHPSIELSQPLWRNWLGNETKRLQNVYALQAENVRLDVKLKRKMFLAEAEVAYWRLAVAREAVAATQDSLKRSVRLRDWNAKRVKEGLADKTDVLQSDAALASRELELQGAIDEEKMAARAFNLMRRVDKESVPESLLDLTESVLAWNMEGKQVEREDVALARNAQKLAEENLNMQKEKYKPSLDLFGSLVLNGRDEKFGDSFREGWETSHNTNVIGVRLTANVDGDLIKRIQSSYAHDEAAARLNAEQKTFEDERELADLSKKLEESRKRLELAKRIEVSHKSKLDHERDRQHLGRTTTYQVLQFEQDYASATLNRIRMEADVLRVVAQLKTYVGGAK